METGSEIQRKTLVFLRGSVWGDAQNYWWRLKNICFQLQNNYVKGYNVQSREHTQNLATTLRGERKQQGFSWWSLCGVSNHCKNIHLKLLQQVSCASVKKIKNCSSMLFSKLSQSWGSTENLSQRTNVWVVKAMVFPVVMYGCEGWTIKKAEHFVEELKLLNCGVGEDSWESLGLQGDPTSPFWRWSVLGVLWKEWC